MLVGTYVDADTPVLTGVMVPAAQVKVLTEAAGSGPAIAPGRLAGRVEIILYSRLNQSNQWFDLERQ